MQVGYSATVWDLVHKEKENGHGFNSHFLKRPPFIRLSIAYTKPVQTISIIITSGEIKKSIDEK